MPEHDYIELTTRDGDSLVQDAYRCLARWLIWDALESIESPRKNYEAARWFGRNGNSSLPFWCTIAEVSPTAVRAEARRRAKSPRAQAILEGRA